MSTRRHSSRPARPRGTRTYEKPPLGALELVARLGERGLGIPDADRAARYVRHIGYYRLSPYTIPFQSDRHDHIFRAGTMFDDVLDLYVFDRSLRLLVMDALERVEVAIRSALTDHMSTTYDDAHWYMDSTHFTDTSKHTRLIRIIEATCDERLRQAPEPKSGSLIHRSALEHYLTTYAEPELPPSWVMVETLTIGQLASTYRNLERRSDRNVIAQQIGLTSKVLESWIQTYVRVRNICAHHGRLWNVGLGVYPVMPTSGSISWTRGPEAMPEHSRKRLYPVLTSLQSVLDTVSPNSSWARRLEALIRPRPGMNRAGMGIPEGWEQNDFWSRHLD